MLAECNKRLLKSKQDRISSLPDELLIQILSDLPTKEAVRNGILSKRWVSLWTYMPTLVLNGETEIKSDAGSRALFYKFVDNALVDRKMPYLRYVNVNTPKKNKRNLESWILAVKERDIPNLELSGSNSKVLQLPRTLISGCKLVELRLGIGVLDFPIASPSCFPNLKVLCLNSVKFKNGDSARNLIFSCPVLQDLQIHVYKERCYTDLYLTSHSLKAFSLSYTSHYYSDHEPRIIIDAPAMEFIRINADVQHMFEMKEFPNLNKADIDIYTFKSSFSKVAIAQQILDLLKHISNAKSLRISPSTVQSLGSRSVEGWFYRCPLPIFFNLRSLEYSKCGRFDWDWKVLMQFLNLCPVLEVLIFKGFAIQEDKECGDGLNDVPLCLVYHLKTIKICQLQMEYRENQVEKFKYFLDNCQVLEKMIFEGFKADGLSTLPRSSPTCQIEFR